MFCQLELLRQCFPPSVRRILEELPDSLDETYERILREIRKPNQGHAHRLLQCLVVAVRPLRVEELAEVLAFEFNTGEMPKLNPGWRWEDQEEAVMSACSSLVTRVKGWNSRVVQFSHFSVKEFLTADRLAEPIRDVTRYHIRLEAAHTILAQACLGTLLRLDDRVDRDSIEGFPLALYAARYWPAHARVGNVTSSIKDGMECLFDGEKRHFSTWLWIYNDDEPFIPSMPTPRPQKPEAVPLYHAARLGLYELAERLIVEHPEHVNAWGGYRGTPTGAAAFAEHANILLLLTEHGADIDAGSQGNITPLSRASYSRMLLECGAAIDAPSTNGMTPLDWAVHTGRTQVVRLLLEHGASVNMRNTNGETFSLLELRAQGHHEIAELLSAYGAGLVE